IIYHGINSQVLGDLDTIGTFFGRLSVSVMMRTQVLISCLLLGSTRGSFFAQENQSRAMQTAEVLNSQISKRISLKYLLFLPKGYEQDSLKRWPLILFLHGIGERGTDPWKVKAHGPPKVAEQIADFPFIVASPQCPDGRWWSNEELSTLLDEVITK